MNHRLVLASASPRRSDLLSRLDLDFDASPADVDERVEPNETATDYVTRLALAKAQAVGREGTVTIGADTAVVLDGTILGKPATAEAARSMLESLSGRVHEVVTGVAVLVNRSDHAVGVEHTSVTFEKLSEERVAWYAAGEEPYDKAGGYAIQGAAGIFADQIRGSASNVVGLPLPLLDRLCHQLGVDLLTFRGSK